MKLIEPTDIGADWSYLDNETCYDDPHEILDMLWDQADCDMETFRAGNMSVGEKDYFQCPDLAEYVREYIGDNMHEDAEDSFSAWEILEEARERFTEQNKRVYTVCTTLEVNIGALIDHVGWKQP
jgi:hypothetical protein